jgi:hypothetical protein
LFLVGASAPVPAASAFSAFDETSKSKVGVTLRELNVPMPGPNHDRMTARDPKCLPSFDPSRKSGCELPPRPTQSDHLMRVEPTTPFVPGHEYTFTVRGPGNPSEVARAKLRVTIDPGRLSTDDLKQVAFVAVGPAQTREVAVRTVVGSCSLRSLSVTQDVRFDLPDTVASYKHLIRHVTLAAPKGGAYRVWEYTPSLCAEIPFGRSGMAPLTDMFLIPCAEDPFTDLTSGSDYLLRGHYGVLEVEDALREGAELPVHLDRRSPGQCGNALGAPGGAAGTGAATSTVASAASLASPAAPSATASGDGMSAHPPKAERVPGACGCNTTSSAGAGATLLQTLAAAALLLRLRRRRRAVG